MTRLANVEKAGYFPLPPTVTDLIATHIAAPHGGRILDPCAGEGSALVTLAEKLHLDPFGVELHEGRAKTAREALNQLVARNGEDAFSTRILHDSYLNLVTSRDGYNLLYLNPPYDHDDEDGRLEYQWLVHTRSWLQLGGLLIWVVPQHMLRFRKATRYLLSWYDRIQIYRFPDDTYDRFRQIVLFGVHRPKAVIPDSIQALQQRGLRCPVCGETQFLSGRPLTVNELKTATRVCSNEAYRSPLYQFTRRRSDAQVRGSFKLYAERERIIRSCTEKGQPVPLHEMEKWHGTAVRDTLRQAQGRLFGYGKVPLAGYIKKRGKGKLDLLLVDEVHQYKGFDSDQGYAMHHLAQAAEKVVALTGTIYGGKASSLFYLLFRLAPEMCRAYIEPDATGKGLLLCL